MEKFSAYQIEQFLKIEHEIICSADRNEFPKKGKFGGEDGSVSSITITTTMTTGILGN